LPDLGPHEVIIQLPDVELDDLVPACEVLCQEGFRLWSLPVARLADLPGLNRVFGRRAKVGVHGVTTRQEVAAAAAAGAVFAASTYALPELVAAAPKLPVILGGLTPSELHAGLKAGAAAVQLVPTEAFGTAYARTLPPMMRAGSLIATGRLERYQAELWLEAGAVGVWPTGLVTATAIATESLDDLRVQLQQWRLHD
jgi:2-dehydro-3-deoxyphosphogluconate aldolase/(4S)-4-hydroxy-2-oxoglutarate aldolase